MKAAFDMTSFGGELIDYNQYKKAIHYLKNADFKLFQEANSLDPTNS